MTPTSARSIDEARPTALSRLASLLALAAITSLAGACVLVIVWKATLRPSDPPVASSPLLLETIRRAIAAMDRADHDEAARLLAIAVALDGGADVRSLVRLNAMLTSDALDHADEILEISEALTRSGSDVIADTGANAYAHRVHAVWRHYRNEALRVERTLAATARAARTPEDRARELIERGDCAEAIVELGKTLGLPPTEHDRARARMERARLELAAGNRAAARALLEQIPDNTAAFRDAQDEIAKIVYFERRETAQRLYCAGQGSAAVAELKTATEPDLVSLRELIERVVSVHAQADEIQRQDPVRARPLWEALRALVGDGQNQYTRWATAALDAGSGAR